MSLGNVSAGPVVSFMGENKYIEIQNHKNNQVEITLDGHTGLPRILFAWSLFSTHSYVVIF